MVAKARRSVRNDKRPEADLLLCRDLGSVNTCLWDENLIETILAAAQSRIRLGIIEFPQQTFTKRYQSIYENVKHKFELLSFSEFRSLFVETCESLTSQYDQELLDVLHKDERFLNIWNDLESVVVGAVSQQYAASVFRSDSNVGDFSDAFWLASRNRLSKENVLRFTWMPTQSKFSCKLDAILAYFIRPEIIDVMNECMRYSHLAYRTREVLVAMANDKELINRLKCPPSSMDLRANTHDSIRNHRSIRVRLRFFVFTLEQIVSYFNELFASKVRMVFKKRADEILQAKTVRDVEKSIKDGHVQLAQLVERSGIRRQVHEAMDRFKAMTDEIRLKSVSNTLTIQYLNNCQTEVRTMLNRLIKYANQYGSDKDNVFYILSVRVGHLNMSNS
ncbi:unnamed protein product [Caenorhabditis bovis]|uniref:Uncharacterized protein n=1 Tax=Caenorhabditis bovis TaxID=2654633 RepID=A0A8S1FDV9_9PELO|nr:unnamed protein product [Caenorhabditis bovis]